MLTFVSFDNKISSNDIYAIVGWKVNNFIDQVFYLVTVALSVKLLSYSKEQCQFIIFFSGLNFLLVIKQPISW